MSSWNTPRHAKYSASSVGVPTRVRATRSRTPSRYPMVSERDGRHRSQRVSWATAMELYSSSASERIDGLMPRPRRQKYS